MSARISPNRGDAKAISPPHPAPELPLGGITAFTTIDFPGRLAAVLYTQGCVWACGYCHNAHLRPMTSERPAVSFASVLRFLEDRRGFLDGVVFSGGEPTLHAALPEAMAAVRDLGFEIGLHTAGSHPERLLEALPLCHWVGLDIKAPFERYERVTAVPESGHRARRSLELALDSGVELECRTTYDPMYLDQRDIIHVARTLSSMGVRRYALQRARQAGTIAYADVRPSLVRALRTLFPSFTLR